MKIKITIGGVLLTLLIIGLIYNLYPFHTVSIDKNASGFNVLDFFCCTFAIITYIVGGLFIIFMLKYIDWKKILDKGFTIDLNRWKNKNNN